jgi:GNAT superfamily N-acetyltransferase
MQPWQQNAANLAASLSFYGPATELGGVSCIVAPVTHQIFNIALLSAPVPDTHGSFERLIALAGEYFRDQGRYWSFWVCRDMLGPRNSLRLFNLFDRECGKVCVADPPGMEAAQLAPPRRPLPALVCRPVRDAGTRRAFCNIVCACFQVPAPVGERLYLPVDAWNHPLQGWIGYHAGEPVCCAAVIDAAGCLGIYSVGTLPAWRGRGFGEAVVRHAVSAAREAGARGPLILQSSISGESLYRAMGFRQTTRYYVFATA